MMNESNLVCNGHCQTRTGFRALTFGDDLSLMPVIFGRFSGYQPERATFQRPGPLTFIFRWGHGDPGTLSLQRGGREVVVRDDVDAQWTWREVSRLHPWSEEFLAPHFRGASFIPEDIVPREQYLSVVAKRRRLDNFARRFGVKLPEETSRSPKAGLQMDPRGLDFDPDQYLGREMSAAGCHVSICRVEMWHGSDGQGTAVKLEAKPASRYGGPVSRVYEEWGVPGIAGWRNHRYLVRVVSGAYIHKAPSYHSSHGVTVDVWETGTR